MNTFLFDILSTIEKKVGRPDSLFHYCSSNGALGIIGDNKEPKGSVWATSIEYMNDSKEYHSLDNLIQRVCNDLTFQAQNPDAHKLLTSHLSLLLKSDPSQVFVSCFSANGNKLSQWRNYTEDHQGYSIGLATDKLKKATEELWTIGSSDCSAYFGPCIYDEQDQYHAMYATAARCSKNSTTLRNGLHLLAPFIKHTSFQEEEEWRLVIHNSVPATYNFRPGKTSMIPYMKVDIGELKDVITKVWIGPTPNPALAFNALKDLMVKKDLFKVGIEYCSIPYRSLV